ncbi:MAG: hypothetical protein ACRDBG_07190 [Waterburya sp.]
MKYSIDEKGNICCEQVIVRSSSTEQVEMELKFSYDRVAQLQKEIETLKAEIEMKETLVKEAKVKKEKEAKKENTKSEK